MFDTSPLPLSSAASAAPGGISMLRSIAFNLPRRRKACNRVLFALKLCASFFDCWRAYSHSRLLDRGLPTLRCFVHASTHVGFARCAQIGEWRSRPSDVASLSRRALHHRDRNAAKIPGKRAWVTILSWDGIGMGRSG